MAGIYIHIPFCKTICTYCDFYKTTNFSKKNELIKAIIEEIKIRKDYLTEEVTTIYFGGGTPSTLSIHDINKILKKLSTTFLLSSNVEVTLEANPDDLTLEYLNDLRKIGVNRLSIGIQSFDDNQLKIINRRHNAETAINCIQLAQKAKFDNISIDLIFGLPTQSLDSWKSQVNTAMQLEVQHISAYGLMYEEKTQLYKQLKTGEITPIDDDTLIEMYNYLTETTAKNNFEQYEISNFSKPNFKSLHNSAYWKQTPYLGIGPSAHSYNGVSRQWNIASNTQYCKRIAQNSPFFEKETLTPQDKYNDFVIVRIRTLEGINLLQLKSDFDDIYYNHCLQNAQKHIENNTLIIENNFLHLTHKGIMISDSIITDLIIV
jgi:oxygen-independent coproporphyrinogen-3 oxidase